MTKVDRDFGKDMDQRLEASKSPKGAARLAIRGIISWDDPVNRPTKIYVDMHMLRLEAESKRLQDN